MGDKAWAIFAAIIVIAVLLLVFGVLQPHVDGSTVAVTVDKSNLPFQFPKLW